MQMIVRGLLIKHNFIGNLSFKHIQWGSIDQISSCENAFSSEIYWEVSLKSQSSCNIKDVMMLSFNLAVLLRSISTACLVNNSPFLVEFFYEFR